MTETKQITMADVQPIHEGDKIAQVTVHEMKQEFRKEENGDQVAHTTGTKHSHKMTRKEAVQMRDDLNEAIGDEWIDVDTDHRPTIGQLVWMCRISKDGDEDLCLSPGDKFISLRRYSLFNTWEPARPAKESDPKVNQPFPVKGGDMWKLVTLPKPPIPKQTEVEMLEARVKKLEEELLVYREDLKTDSSPFLAAKGDPNDPALQ